MSIEYKTLTYSIENIQSLPSLGKDNWNLCTIYDGKIFLSREVKKIVNRKDLNETPEFIQFYTLYPKKKAPKSALQSWHRLSKTDQDKVLEVLPYHISYWKFKYGKTIVRGKEKIKDDTYIPFPSSWLNSGAYKDEGLEVDGKSFDELRQEKSMIEKRRKEEEQRKKNEEKEREEAEEVSLIIRRLKEYGKYGVLLEEAEKQCPPNSMQAILDIRARGIVSSNPIKWRKLYL